MCTLSWNSHRSGGYDLFFNRDEQISRSKALAPSPHSGCGASSFIAPIDPDGGGSWIFLNSHGLSACVLNAYTDSSDQGPAAATRRSRGRLLLDLAGQTDLTNFSHQLSSAVRKHDYAPCYLAAFALNEAMHLFHWDGGQLNRIQPKIDGFLTTSSHRPREVIEHREQTFLNLNGGKPHSADDLDAFHEGQHEAANCWNVRMERSDARTVSRSHLHVSDSESFFCYSNNHAESFAPWETYRWQANEVEALAL